MPTNSIPEIICKNEHLTIPAAVICEIIPHKMATHVCGVYYAKDHKYLIAADNDDLFKSLHKTHKTLLKDKNIHGDKSICIQPLIIDFDLKIQNEKINYEVQHDLRILTLYL